jgi:imidazolonepropionase-like amidohydrolase
MRTLILPLAVLFSALLASEPTLAETAVAVTVVTAGRLLDPRTGNVLSPAAVVIAGNRIKEVGPPARLQAGVPPGATIIDLGSATLLPGLIDSHTHLLLDVIPPTEAESTRRSNGDFVPGLLLAITMSPSERVLRGAQLAREDLESGFTTVRNLGHSGIDGDAALRDAITAGRVPGPRILAAGRKLTARGSYVQSLNPALADALVRQEFLLIDSPDGAREAVRTNTFYNVDVIKMAIDDDITQAEASAIVDEAHRDHLKVAVHAFTPSSIQMAINAGADSIEHGNQITEEQLKLMRDKGMFVVLTPTFYGGRFSRILEGTIVMSPALRSEMGSSAEGSRKRYDSFVQRVLKSGVKYALGSDMCWFYPGQTRGQATASVLTAVHDAGMPSLDIIRAVTTSAAELIGWQDRVGAVEPGKYADLVAVAGNPIADIGELERVVFVMQDGHVVRNDVHSR